MEQILLRMGLEVQKKQWKRLGSLVQDGVRSRTGRADGRGGAARNLEFLMVRDINIQIKGN